MHIMFTNREDVTTFDKSKSGTLKLHEVEHASHDLASAMANL